MYTFYSNYGKEKLKLSGKPMASGGEGKIYVVDNKKGYVAKIFHEGKRNSKRREKLKYMIQNLPHERKHLVWPEDILLDGNRNFVGYLMKKVSGRKLELFCISKVERGFYDEFPNFEVRSKSTLKHRIRVAYWILANLQQLHEAGSYTLVDLKPENILLHTTREFHILDLDSVQISLNNQVLFAATVTTPEYAPPEQSAVNQQEQLIDYTWDYFSWAVILYKFLYGVHPYAASSNAPYDEFTSLKQKIEQGLFVHNPKLKESFKHIPILHDLFKESPKPIQKLFMQCFVDGHENAEARPSFGDWLYILEHWMQEDQKVSFAYTYNEALEADFPKLDPNRYVVRREKEEIVNEEQGGSFIAILIYVIVFIAIFVIGSFAQDVRQGYAALMVLGLMFGIPLLLVLIPFIGELISDFKDKYF